MNQEKTLYHVTNFDEENPHELAKELESSKESFQAQNPTMFQSMKTRLKKIYPSGTAGK